MRNMHLWTAGQRRKFARNMQENLTARQIGYTGFSLARLVMPILLVLGMATLAYAGSQAAGTGSAGTHGLAVLSAATVPLAIVSKKNINALRQRKIDLNADAKKVFDAIEAAEGKMTAEQRTSLTGYEKDLEQVNADLKIVEAFLAEERYAGEAARTQDNAAKAPWKGGFGEFLQSVAQFGKSQGRTMDPRLQAALGANETVPAEGGFLVIPEFATEILKRTYDVGLVSSKCMKMPMQSSRLVMHAVDEDSRKDGSRWGGIQAFWLAESGTYNPTKPKFREMQLVANKLIGLCYATEEQLADGPALEAYIRQAFPDEFSFQIDAALINGSGAGQPLGILNSGAVVTVAADSPQTTKTVSFTNVLNMWARLFARSRATSAWFINQDVEPALYPLALANPSGSILFQSPLYTPPGVNGNAGPYGLLLGRPVIPIEQASTLGTTGDIILADMQQYLLATRSDVRADTSIHVAFLTGEQAFRFMLRLDGQPTWKKPLTPYKGANTLSPFITVASR